jgi:hypothetical protein
MLRISGVQQRDDDVRVENTSAIVEARRVFDGVGGLSLHDTDRRPNRPPRCDHIAMSLGSFGPRATVSAIAA